MIGNTLSHIHFLHDFDFIFLQITSWSGSLRASWLGLLWPLPCPETEVMLFVTNLNLFSIGFSLQNSCPVFSQWFNFPMMNVRQTWTIWRVNVWLPKSVETMVEPRLEIAPLDLAFVVHTCKYNFDRIWMIWNNFFLSVGLTQLAVKMWPKTSLTFKIPVSPAPSIPPLVLLPIISNPKELLESAKSGWTLSMVSWSIPQTIFALVLLKISWLSPQEVLVHLLVSTVFAVLWLANICIWILDVKKALLPSPLLLV